MGAGGEWHCDGGTEGTLLTVGGGGGGGGGGRSTPTSVPGPHPAFCHEGRKLGAGLRCACQ